MKIGTMCSGIDAAAFVAKGRGDEVLYASEIDSFACEIHSARYPDVPNFGDLTKLKAEDLPAVDLLVAGTPCQDFSSAGPRKSLDGDRGQLTLRFVRLVNDLADLGKIKALLWENVPGVLNTPDNAFGCFLGGLVGSDGPISLKHGRRWPDAGAVSGPRGRACWRVLDAQHFGLPQRRRRVFLVFDFGTGWIDPAAVLFERVRARGDQRSSRKGRKATGSPENFVQEGIQDLSGGEGAKSPKKAQAGLNRVIAFALRGRAEGAMPEVHGNGQTVGCLRASGGGSSRDYFVINHFDKTWVRRMTPTEAERLMGYPDSFTKLSERTTDTDRFRVLGNSKSTKVIKWLFARIAANAVSNQTH